MRNQPIKIVAISFSSVRSFVCLPVRQTALLLIRTIRENISAELACPCELCCCCLHGTVCMTRKMTPPLGWVPELFFLRNKEGAHATSMVASECHHDEISPACRWECTLYPCCPYNPLEHIRPRGCTRITIDPRIPTMPGWSTSGFDRPGRHCFCTKHEAP